MVFRAPPTPLSRVRCCYARVVTQYYDRLYPYLIETYPNMWKADVNDLDSFTWVRVFTQPMQPARSSSHPAFVAPAIA